jgi:hypothetical protein
VLSLLIVKTLSSGFVKLNNAKPESKVSGSLFDFQLNRTLI